MSKTLQDLKADLLTRKGVSEAYAEVAPGYAVARAVIAARTGCGLTQAELAERMNTSQSFVVRLENGTVLPTMKTFLRVAAATGTRPRFELERV